MCAVLVMMRAAVMRVRVVVCVRVSMIVCVIIHMCVPVPVMCRRVKRGGTGRRVSAQGRVAAVVRTKCRILRTGMCQCHARL